jgi:hypothetical protein
MRDIRPDLRERLQSVRDKRESLQRALDNLSVQEQMYTKLLAGEDAMFEVPPSTLFDGDEAKPQGSPLSQVLLEALKSKPGPATLQELKDSAARQGISFGAKQPGRVIHFAMLGMAQHNLVTREGDGRWKLAEGPIN